jgi:hypothetical protein
MEETGAASKLAERIREHWDGREDSVDEWLQACHDADDDEPPECTDWSVSMLCQYHGLKKFVELLVASEKTIEDRQEVSA